MSILSAFTNQLVNLIENLCEMYPNDPDLSFTKTSVILMKKSNPRKLQELFDKHVAIYQAEILSKNEVFLINNDFVEEQFSKIDDQDYAIKIMKNLRKYWTDIDTESKLNIWKYLQVLVVLNNKSKKNKSPILVSKNIA